MRERTNFATSDISEGRFNISITQNGDHVNVVRRCFEGNKEDLDVRIDQNFSSVDKAYQEFRIRYNFDRFVDVFLVLTSLASIYGMSSKEFNLFSQIPLGLLTGVCVYTAIKNYNITMADLSTMHILDTNRSSIEIG